MYTGREYYRGLKLYYNRARYYDPKLARFISRDPIDIADDVNLYAYVGNNSVMFEDLLGIEKKMIGNTETVRILYDKSGVGHIRLQLGFDVYTFGAKDNLEGLASAFMYKGIKGGVDTVHISDYLIEDNFSVDYYDLNISESEKKGAEKLYRLKKI